MNRITLYQKLTIFLRKIKFDYFKMKISFGAAIKDQPWGGGNQFLKNISNYLHSKDIKIVYNLNDADIDIIVLLDPRISSASSTFNHLDIANYINNKNKKVIVVHRINECDERKGTNFVNKNLIEANSFADHTVFISTWLKELFSKYKKFENFNVVLNGANNKLFSYSNLQIKKNKKIKIVTHHWSTNINKGFEIYEHLDNLLDDNNFSKLVEFTYIGNLPKYMKFRNTKCLSPKQGIELANIIKDNHIYITGSLNEPGGNHQNEGLNCGLPVLYLDSGCMREYCEGFGISYKKENLKEKIFEMKKKYDYFKIQLKNYPYNSELMCKSYEKIFLNLFKNKSEITNKRVLPKINFIQKLKYKLKLKFI